MVVKRAVAFTLLLVSCGIPRDPEHTLERVQVSGLRVGVAERPPWTYQGRGAVSEAEYLGIEVDLVRTFADNLGTPQVIWERGSESDILESIELGNLDLAIGGFTADNPWSAEVTFIQPYFTLGEEEHVMAVPEGENAWIVRVERFLRSQLDRVPALLEKHST